MEQLFWPHRDVTTLMLKMNEDGSCILYTGYDMGNDNGYAKTNYFEVPGISLARSIRWRQIQMAVCGIWEITQVV